MRELYVNYERALIIPDVHHDIRWVERIIEKEKGNFDGIVFLGDYMDTYHRGMPHPEEIGRVLGTIYMAHPTAFLVGNHDIQYIAIKAGRYINREHGGTPYTHPQFMCSGFDPVRAEEFTRDFPQSVIDTFQPFVVVQDYILSHAGLNERIFPYTHPAHSNFSTALAKLYDSCDHDLYTLNPSSPLFYVPRSRGGRDPYGGPLWQDWIIDFEDDLPLPQIVGHTGRKKVYDQLGRSHCLDNNQTTYGILANGELTVKTA